MKTTRVVKKNTAPAVNKSTSVSNVPSGNTPGVTGTSRDHLRLGAPTTDDLDLEHARLRRRQTLGALTGHQGLHRRLDVADLLDVVVLGVTQRQVKRAEVLGQDEHLGGLRQDVERHRLVRLFGVGEQPAV